MDNIRHLSDLELDIYHYVTSHKSQVIDMRLKELASLLHVSPAMITRVAKKLGYNGFVEWKVAIKIDEQEYVKPNEENLNYIMDFFQKVNNGDFDEKIHQAGKMVADADDVLFYGLGINAGIASAAAGLFNRKGKRAFGVTDFSTRTDLFNEHDLGIVLSVSGETPEMIQVITLLKQQKTPVIVITNVGTSLAARSADLALCYYMPSHQNRYYYSSATQVPVIYYLECIANELDQYDIR